MKQLWDNICDAATVVFVFALYLSPLIIVCATALLCCAMCNGVRP